MENSSPFEDGSLCWVDLAAARIDDATDFYGRVFGWSKRGSLVPDGPRYEQFELEGVAIAGAGELDAGSIESGVRSTWNVYFATRDCDRTFARALELGAQVIAEPMTFGEAGRAGFLADPGGAVFALWEGGNHSGFGRSRSPGSLGWHELASTDLRTAESFYGALFGWRFHDFEQSAVPYRLIETKGGRGGGMMQIDAAADWAWWRGWKIYFSVEDVRKAASRIREAAGVVRQEPQDTAVGPIAVFEDRCGAPFGLMQPMGDC
ncbi:MAG: VOC family protein [Planctomycetota bacterium]